MSETDFSLLAMTEGFDSGLGAASLLGNHITAHSRLLAHLVCLWTQVFGQVKKSPDFEKQLSHPASSQADRSVRVKHTGRV